MARDTGTDAPTLVETNRWEIGRFDLDWIEYDGKLWSVESNKEVLFGGPRNASMESVDTFPDFIKATEDTEKIETGKSDVQPKVEENPVTYSHKGVSKTFRNQLEYELYMENCDEENWLARHYGHDRGKNEAEKSDVQPMVEGDGTLNAGHLRARGKEIEDKWQAWLRKADMQKDSVNEFDEGIKGLTERRGDVYGHPQDDFNRIIQMQKALGDCDDEFARHIMNMICVKMSRLVKTPDHSDSWLDIVGYVRTWFMIKEKKGE